MQYAKCWYKRAVNVATPTAGSPQAREGMGIGSRLAIVGMLSLLTGLDIWIFTAAEISALPQVQVHVAPGKMPSGTPSFDRG
jgi:hypothetical protein